MTLKITKENLIQLLADQDNKVIALSGKWGTGKSHLWREVKADSTDDAVKGALYVSLFGLSHMNQIKLKLVQSALPSAEKNNAMWEKLRIGAEAARKMLNSLHKGFSALDELALLAVPTLLKDRVIVLDDIERKHEKLSIEEVLGFIDEFTQQYGARFVLILNSDQLDNRKVWDVLREKVVDQELRLSTSTEEAFAIACGLTPPEYGDRIRDAIQRCDITNIRIIRKVIKAVNRVLGNQADLSDVLLTRVVPSTVLLSAIHYKGIEDGPDFDFVLAQGTPNDWSKYLNQHEDKDVDKESQRKSKWKLLLNDLDIHSCDEYEVLVIEFLQSGMFDPTKVKAIIGRYATEEEAMTVRDNLKKFFQRLIWNHRLTEAELLEEAKSIIPRINFIDAYSLTALCESVEELPGGDVVAKTMLERWIAEFRKKKHEDFDDDDMFGRKLHPAIKAEFQLVKNHAQATETLLDACVFIAKNSGWNTRQELAMKAATVADFQSTIRDIDIDDLRIFMRRMLEMTMQPGGYRQHFGQATDRFVEACKNLAQDPNTGRLGKLIKTLFADSKQSHLLDGPVASAVV
ncbi:hypothetical protein ASE39_17805 [Acidovorax sp. Root267]|uniref:hypothetical protein n=1 Tax=Acidovorax sp. Root267 TaxID=1736505 RepID=UPI00070CCD83|nr:hypothetical protein [Acidovorax sp. Root267]KRD13885.1 hypothetical protein ASE39_17805 [Acidovorax sp. Root267]